MKLADTLTKWYGSHEVASAVLSGQLGSMDRTLRSIGTAPTWRNRHRVSFAPPPGMAPEPKVLTPLEAAMADNGKSAKFGPASEVACTLALRPSGVSVPEYMAAIGTDHQGASVRLSALLARGFLHKAKVQGHHVRYFVRLADAKAWAEAAVPALVKTLQRHAAEGTPPPPRPGGPGFQQRGTTILRLASRPQGIATGELAIELDVSLQIASASLRQLARAGHLIKAPMVPSMKQHFFRLQEHVDAWVAAHQAPAAPTPAAFLVPAKPARKADTGQGRHTPTAAQSQWYHGGPASPPKPQHAITATEVIWPAHVKVQDLGGHPGCDLRYQVRPGAAVEGAGFAEQWKRLRGGGADA